MRKGFHKQYFQKLDVCRFFGVLTTAIWNCFPQGFSLHKKSVRFVWMNRHETLASSGKFS